MENIGDRFSNLKILSQNQMVITIYWKYSFDRNDESSPEWWSDRIGDRLWYGFDWERIRAEKIDCNDDLTALVIWPEGESLLYIEKQWIWDVTLWYTTE